jgi:hypothetical protein
MAWTDPTPGIIDGIRELIFRTAIAATNTTTQQIFPATDTVALTVYVSHYGYLAAALIVMFLGVCLVFPIFVGWWQLGRKVSLSPMEIANAFEAPLLIENQASGDVKMLLKGVGSMDLRYGEVARLLDNSQEIRRLAIARSETTIKPARGVAYLG